MKRFSLLLFAGLFGLATLQTAGAQDDSDNHDVTIKVETANTISVEKDVTVTVDAIGEWVGSAATDFTVTTNDGNGKRVNAEVTTNEDEFGENLKLRVSAKGLSKGSGKSNVELVSGAAHTVATGYENTEETGTLTYNAKANAKFDPSPSSDKVVEVEYTLTSN
jgi:hypothetical protein